MNIEMRSSQQCQRSKRIILFSSRKLSSFRSVYGLFIDGKEVFPPGFTTFDVKSPASQQYLTKVAHAKSADVNNAAIIAQNTFESGVWSRVDVRERSKVLYKVADNLRNSIPYLLELEVAQTGRAIREMKAQLGRLPEWFEYFGSLIRTTEGDVDIIATIITSEQASLGSVPPFLGNYVNYVKRVPLGVVAQLTPWNHPMLIAIKKIAPALAAGNSVLLKPSELAPVSVLELGKIITDSGLPNGVLNILPGIGPETGQALCSHPYVKKVDLTGGTSTGRAVGEAAGKNLASVLSELGGKAPMLIFEDADIHEAVNGVAFATFVASGQTCIMGARLLVHVSIYEQFLSTLVAKVKRIRLGDPTNIETQMGPVISLKSLDRITTMVSEAVKQGAKVLCGGTRPTLPPPFNNGYYYQPTILEVTQDMEIWKEEVFGPVLAVSKFSTEAEAIRLANDSQYGLAAAVWTKDVARAHRVADRLDVGIIWINDHHRNDPSSPWGGMKNSGIGRENGIFALQEYTQSKSVVVRIDSTPFDWFEHKDARYS